MLLVRMFGWRAAPVVDDMIRDWEIASVSSKRIFGRFSQCCYFFSASKATILPAKDIPVPTEKFQESFGESWEKVLKEDRACNAMDACKQFGCNAEELNAAWGKAKKVVKFGGGFYCGLVSMNNKELYVFNAFFMSMRSKFVGEGTSIYCFVVEFSPKTLSWEAFRNNVLGPTDPAEAPPGSLRKTILDDYKALGLTAKPDKGKFYDMIHHVALDFSVFCKTFILTTRVQVTMVCMPVLVRSKVLPKRLTGSASLFLMILLVVLY